MKGQPVSPNFDRLTADQGGEALDRVRLPDDEGLLLVESGRAQKSVPLQPGSIGGELGHAPDIVCLVNVLARRAVEMRRSDLELKSHDPLHVCSGLAIAGQLQQLANVGLVSLPEFLHLRFG